MNRIVVDASVIVDALAVDGRPLPQAELVSPSLLDYEVINTIRRHDRLGVFGADDAIATFAALAVTRHDAGPLIPQIWAMRANFSAYDASYVALAQALGVPLLTRDARLARAATPYCDVIAQDS